MDTTSWKVRAKRLRNEINALHLAARDPRTPWYAKVLAALIMGYALSPIDLIPDFVPILGYLDDLLIVPAGIALLMRMIPQDVMVECREKARSQIPSKSPRKWIAAVLIVMIWMLAIYACLRFLSKIVTPRN